MLLTNISKLITIESGVVEDAALLIEGETIRWFGPVTQMPRVIASPKSEAISMKKFDCSGGVVTPGLVDCHTHLVHAGSRAQEYVERAAGKSYLEIAKTGGGILSTVAATRAASFSELYAESARRLKEAVAFGTTTVEIKTGYGLDVATELKMFEVIQKLQKEFPVNIVPTFMGAHTVPAEYKNRRAEYVRLVVDEMLPAVGKMKIAKFCDIFVEEEAFTADEARRIVSAAKKYGMLPKLHVDQLTAAHGAELAAELRAVSADHLEKISDAGIQALAQSKTVAILLPGASFFLGVLPAPARKILNGGVRVAIATDYNPGTNPNLNLMLAATQAVSLLKMTTAEVWEAITLNAAAALNLEDRIGSIRVGKQADLVVWDAPDENYLLYRYSKNCVRNIFIKGEEFPLP